MRQLHAFNDEEGNFNLFISRDDKAYICPGTSTGNVYIKYAFVTIVLNMSYTMLAIVIIQVFKVQEMSVLFSRLTSRSKKSCPSMTFQ